MKGFTLIEAMIAVTILSVSISGPLFTASRAIVAAQISRDQLTALYLAQEGVEYIRAMRDDEYLALYPSSEGTSVAAWNNFLNGSDAASISQCRSTACSLELTQNMGYGDSYALSQCSMGNPCSDLYLLETGVYATTRNRGGLAGDKTSFSRTIQLVDSSGAGGKIVSTVTWSFHGIPYTVTVNDYITPWQ